jgi:hypothetical protein
MPHLAIVRASVYGRGEMDLHRGPLAVTPEQMREIGYQTVDLPVDQLTDISIAAMCRGDPNALRRA